MFYFHNCKDIQFLFFSPFFAIILLYSFLPFSSFYPIFKNFKHTLIKHYQLLNSWEIILPWLIIAFLNPFIEEFYWRGLLLDYTNQWNSWLMVIITSFLFSANHYVFAINTDLFKGFPVFISTMIMGIVWAFTYKKTKSLTWAIFAHFLVDFFSLSVPSFLDLYKQGW